MLMIITTLILLILTIILLSGKGGFLIAGFNVLSKKEKKKYNEKKISQITGVLLAFIVVGMFVDMIFGKYLTKYSSVVFISVLLLLFIDIFIAYKIWKKD